MSPSFMELHRSIGEVVTEPYRNRITVASSAWGGNPRVFVHGRTAQGQSIGGGLTVDRARMLVSQLQEAIEYAESVAAEQRVESTPQLERQLERARADRTGAES